MNVIKRNIHWMICTAVLVAVFCCGICKADDTTIRFHVQSSSGTDVIVPWEAGDGSYHVFLPSYAEPERVTAEIISRYAVSLGDVALSEGMDCSFFRFETEYPLEINGSFAGNLQFHRSASVAALYINTGSGSMERIHEDKSYEEPAAIALYTADGVLNFTDSTASLKGRGNATWHNEKKPYALTLSADGDLLGMGAAVNWVLLANAADATNLNNKLVYDLAGQTGLEWSPESRYVDVYLNGEYNGLYLLTEKIEVGSQRLDIDTAAGDFLCKIDLSERQDSLRNPFTTQSSRTVEINEPRILTQTRAAQIESLVNQMEVSLFSGADLRLDSVLDLDSWIRRYLIDEISGNIDADLASSYFYYSGGRFHAGPVWDYDMTFGNSERNDDPRALIARNACKSAVYGSPYYGALYENKAFRLRMKEIYESEFLPLLQQLIDGGIEALAAEIASASAMNRLRWAAMFESMYSQQLILAQTPDTLLDYVTERVDFLNRAWLEDIPYCTVQLGYNSWSPYRSRAVEYGGLMQIPDVDTVWLDAATGEPFDFSQPVTEDKLLLSQVDIFYVPETAEPDVPGESITMLSITAMAVLLLWMAVADIRRRSGERRNADAGTHVSP